MPRPTSNLSVFTQEGLACIRFEGCANAAQSPHFKSAVAELSKRGIRCFVLDLTQCLLMDSTFLGVVARCVLSGQSHTPITRFLLYNPSPRVKELLESLGIAPYLTVFYDTSVPVEKMTPVDVPVPSTNKRELNEICLEAHVLLARLNPKNADKFKDVIQFLKESIEKADGAKVEPEKEELNGAGRQEAPPADPSKP